VPAGSTVFLQVATMMWVHFKIGNQDLRLQVCSAPRASPHARGSACVPKTWLDVTRPHLHSGQYVPPPLQPCKLIGWCCMDWSVICHLAAQNATRQLTVLLFPSRACAPFLCRPQSAALIWTVPPAVPVLTVSPTLPRGAAGKPASTVSAS
jgi:hypothetical protein